MIVYESTKDMFLEDVFNDDLTTNICENYRRKIGNINESEVRSWDKSMQYMYRILNDSETPDNAGIAIEFNIPHTSKRVDMLVSGYDEEKSSVVVIELKQWSEVQKIEGKEAIVKTASSWYGRNDSSFLPGMVLRFSYQRL